MNICAQSLSYVQLFVTPWTEAHQAPLSVESSRQEYWSGPPGMELCLLHLRRWQADSLPLELPGKPLLKVCRIDLKPIPSIHVKNSWPKIQP